MNYDFNASFDTDMAFTASFVNDGEFSSEFGSLTRGEDGFSPIVDVSKTGKITTISITDKTHTTTSQISDGNNGDPGPTGAAIVSTQLIGTDPQGGNIYRQTFDNGITATFTAPKGDTGGVASWNTRTGAVTPQQDDYTLGMVGGIPLTNTDIDELWNSL